MTTETVGEKIGVGGEMISAETKSVERKNLIKIENRAIVIDCRFPFRVRNSKSDRKLRFPPRVKVKFD